MKKILLTIAIVFYGYFSYAQNAPLYLWGTGLDGSTYQTSAIYSDASNGLLIEGPLNSSGVKLPITLSWRGGGSPFTINPSGNIGIGTATPGGKLTISGNNIIATNTASSATANETTLTLNPANDFGTAGGYANLGPSISGFIESAGNPNIPSGLKFYTYSGGTQSNRFTILGSNGNVGIGITSPNNKLDVYSNNERMHIGNGTTDLTIGQWDNVTNRIESSGRSLFFTTYTGAINFGISGLTSLSVANSGNVLIGQTTQTNTAYKLDVNGSARANEIVVNTTGADFVFDDKYSLPKLSDVKSYIDKNHHLPEIPSAEQMKKDGLSVGEMNTKLLQKIEELTLYLIEEHDKNAIQETRIATLEAALLKLTSKSR